MAKDAELRTHLAGAARRLRKLDPTSSDADIQAEASAIDLVLAPNGWSRLRREDPNLGTNVPIGMDRALRAAIETAVAADPAVRSITAAVNDGFAAVLAGHFTPPEGAGLGITITDRVNLNVRPDPELTAQVKARGLVVSKTAAHYLMHRYGLGPYAADARPKAPRGKQRNLEIPSAWRDVIRSGDSADDVINHGFEEFLAGSFDPVVTPWTSEQQDDLVILKVRPRDDLFDAVQEAGRERKGGTLRPSQVAIAYLADEYGL
ncbi:hypothetical protein [Streptomyces sp. NPDC008150]|uniref:hypothetical protein n=1 Tax=Streptomyces sp. NPDC008150 TaxID=3364816 RepID=UPI0036EA4D85